MRFIIALSFLHVSFVVHAGEQKPRELKKPGIGSIALLEYQDQLRFCKPPYPNLPPETNVVACIIRKKFIRDGIEHPETFVSVFAKIKEKNSEETYLVYTSSNREQWVMACATEIAVFDWENLPD